MVSKMDVLYPCSLCSRTFQLKKHFLMHMRLSHLSNAPLNPNDDYESLFNCSQQFCNSSLSNEYMHLNHRISMKNLTEYVKTQIKKEAPKESYACLLLNDFLPDNYTYKLLTFKDLLFGQFKAKFIIFETSKETFLDWLNCFCQKSKVTYMTEKIPFDLLENVQRKVYKCKNIDYWNNATNSILQKPTNCKASLTVVIKPLKKNSDLTKTIVLLRHTHCHPMNYFTTLKHYQAICNVYNQLTPLLQNGYSAADALHQYKMKILQNHGKIYYLKLMDSGIKLDVEFIYDLYYMYMDKSRFSTPFIRQIDSLIKSISYYNYTTGKESAVLDIVRDNIVIAIRSPLMEINFDTVFLCSTNFSGCKTWFMFSQNDNEIMVPVGVIVAAVNEEYMLKAGLNLWIELGGSVKSVVVEFAHMSTLQSVFPEASVSVSGFHFLLGVWKWLFSVTKKNNLNDELNCFVELKKLVCADNFIAENCLNTNFAIDLTEKYPNFKEFMENICKPKFLFYPSLIAHPCSNISERKLIYYHTKSLSILQMFNFVTNEIDIFYEHLSINTSNNQKIIFNDFIKMKEDEDNFTYTCVSDSCSMYLVKSVNNDTFFVDMDIGLCSCTINNVCSPCVHQMFLNKHFNDEFISNSSDTYMLGVSTNNDRDGELGIEKNQFKNILSEFQSVNKKIREEFIADPDYFKTGIQSFVSTLKNNITLDKSLFLACHSLNNVN